MRSVFGKCHSGSKTENKLIQWMYVGGWGRRFPLKASWTADKLKAVLSHPPYHTTQLEQCEDDHIMRDCPHRR